MAHRTPTRTPLRLALALRAWVVALLAIPTFGFAASPSASGAGLEILEIGLETVVRAAPPLPASAARPVDTTAAAESEEEEDAKGRHGPQHRGLGSDQRLAFVGDQGSHSTAVDLAVPSTPLRLHRLHNRGPPLA